jgi:hypothetical protein
MRASRANCYSTGLPSWGENVRQPTDGPTPAEGLRPAGGSGSAFLNSSPLRGERVAALCRRVRGYFRRLPAGGEEPCAPLPGSKHHQRPHVNQHAGRKAADHAKQVRARCPSTVLFPTRERKAFHEAVLDEILQERVVSSRDQRRPPGVKRKLSSFPLRPRGACGSVRIEFSECIRIIK